MCRVNLPTSMSQVHLQVIISKTDSGVCCSLAVIDPRKVGPSCVPGHADTWAERGLCLLQQRGGSRAKGLEWATSSTCLQVDISKQDISGSRLHFQFPVRKAISGTLGESCIPASWSAASVVLYSRPVLSRAPCSHHSSFMSLWGPNYSLHSIP